MRYTFVFVFIFTSSFLFAQGSADTTKYLFSVRDLYYNGGPTFYGFPDGTLADFRKLAPNSLFLNKDLNGYTEHNGYSVSTGDFFSVVAGLNIKNKRKNFYRPSPQLRIGFSYYSSADVINTLKHTDRVRFDSATYNAQTVYLDSVFVNRYRLEHLNKQMRLDLSLIFRTDRTKRWSFYGGAGITLGGSLYSASSFSYHYSIYVDSVDIAGHSISKNAKDHGHDTITYESFGARRGVCYSLYFPMGMDFRVGKRIEFLRHVHFFYEMRPGFYSVWIPELHLYHARGIDIGFGMRIAID